MSEYFTVYPLLTEDVKNNSGFEAKDWEFQYTDVDDFKIICENKTENAIGYSAALKDPRGVWAAETFGLNVLRVFKFADYSVFFGSKGLAAKNAEIGLALSWISTGSDCRGVLPLGSFYQNETPEEVFVEHYFDRDLLKGSLILDIIIYLKNSGIQEEDEKHLAKKIGTVLGTLSHCEFFIDGDGSFFPIAEVNEPGRPLWWVDYNDGADPFTDMFTENNVAVYFNAAHPNYRALKIGSSLKDSPLFLEVISTALMIIIDSVKSNAGPDWDLIISGEDFDSGSIAQAINYFVNKLEWDITSPVNLSNSIRAFFDKNLQEGALCNEEYGEN